MKTKKSNSYNVSYIYGGQRGSATGVLLLTSDEDLTVLSPKKIIIIRELIKESVAKDNDINPITGQILILGVNLWEEDEI